MEFHLVAIGIIGMVVLLFALLGRKTDEKTPTYDKDSQIIPRAPRETEVQPEVGASQETEST